MIVDVSFKFAKVYDITRFDVVKGEEFSLIASLEPGMRWFSDNDPILSITNTTSTTSVAVVNIVASEEGHSTLLILNETFNVVKEINVTVVDAIIAPAASLNIKADSKPLPKTKTS